MIRIVFPYILFVSLVSLAGGVLNVYRKFAIPAFTPVLLNLSIIGAALFLAPYCDPPIKALAWGVFIGGVAQLALQIRPLAKIGDAAAAALRLARRGRAAGAAGDGAGGARRVGGADLGAHQHAARGAAGRRAHLVDHLRRPADGVPDARCSASRSARCCCRRSRSITPTRTPANTRRCSTGACGSRSCSRCRRRSRCGCSRCRWSRRSTSTAASRVDDVLQTRAALLGYSVGLLGLILVKILAPGFYARQMMKTPVKIAFVTVLVAQTLAVILMFPLGHAGLTLSTSLGACLNAGAAVLVPAQARHLRAAAGLARVPGEARRRAVRAGARCCWRSPARRRSGSHAGAVGEGRAARRRHRRRRGGLFRRAVAAGIPARATSTGRTRPR